MRFRGRPRRRRRSFGRRPGRRFTGRRRSFKRRSFRGRGRVRALRIGYRM